MDIEVNSDYQLAYFHQKKFFKQPSRDNWDVAQKKWARFNFRYPFGLLYCRQRLCQVIHLACVPHPKMEHNMAGWSPEKWDRLIELLEEVHLLCLRRDSSLKIARIEDAQKQNSRIDEGLDTMKIFQDKDIIVNCCKYNRMLAPFRLDLEQQPKEKGRFDKPSVNTEKVKALYDQVCNSRPMVKKAFLKLFDFDNEQEWDDNAEFPELKDFEDLIGPLTRERPFCLTDLSSTIKNTLIKWSEIIAR